MRTLRAWLLTISTISGLATPAGAQDALRLAENFRPGSGYRVAMKVGITGTLTLPTDNKQIAVKGSSMQDYDERILLEKNGKVERTIRYFRQIDFQRTVGAQTQQSTVRPEVRLLVLLRHQQYEVPFSPNGPLLWSEIDLVRTDVFTPALQGLLPAVAVRVGAQWPADNAAVLELTDLERLEQGGLTCSLESIGVDSGRRRARIGFRGAVGGIGEDGPCRHELAGHLLFDLDTAHISVVEARGKQTMLDKAGKTMGVIEGSFSLTREILTQSLELSDQAIKNLVTEPNDVNTRLLYEDVGQGVKFLYPRRWRVAEVKGKQIALDEKRGNGLLITLESPTKMPTAGQFQEETYQWLSKNSGKVSRTEPPHSVQTSPTQVDHFGLEAEVKSEKVWLDYHVVRQTLGGATLAGRLTLSDRASLQEDLSLIAKSLRLSKPQ